jgi:hypothetical protein
MLSFILQVIGWFLVYAIPATIIILIDIRIKSGEKIVVRDIPYGFGFTLCFIPTLIAICNLIAYILSPITSRISAWWNSIKHKELF